MYVDMQIYAVSYRHVLLRFGAQEHPTANKRVSPTSWCRPRISYSHRFAYIHNMDRLTFQGHAYSVHFEPLLFNFASLCDYAIKVPKCTDAHVGYGAIFFSCRSVSN